MAVASDDLGGEVRDVADALEALERLIGDHVEPQPHVGVSQHVPQQAGCVCQ